MSITKEITKNVESIDVKSNLHPVSQWIRNRKSTYAYYFKDQEIPKNTIEEIVTNGLWAPTHKMTQPWRFVLLEGGHQQDLGAFMLKFYKEKLSKEKFPESRYQETLAYAKNATLLAIVFQPNKKAKLPEWEEIAAISCAVQNMWISCSAMEIGCYWDTGDATIQYCKENIHLEDHEKSLGILFMGVIENTSEHQRRKRKSIDQKLTYNLKPITL